MNKSGFATPQVLIFALALAAVAGGYLTFKPEIKNEVNAFEPVINSTIEEVENSDWQTYHNEKFGFEFKYPKDYIVDENSESGYPITILGDGYAYRVDYGKGGSPETIKNTVNSYIGIVRGIKNFVWRGSAEDYYFRENDSSVLQERFSGGAIKPSSYTNHGPVYRLSSGDAGCAKTSEIFLNTSTDVVVQFNFGWCLEEQKEIAEASNKFRINFDKILFTFKFTK